MAEVGTLADRRRAHDHNCCEISIQTDSWDHEMTKRSRFRHVARPYQAAKSEARAVVRLSQMSQAVGRSPRLNAINASSNARSPTLKRDRPASACAVGELHAPDGCSTPVSSLRKPQIGVRVPGIAFCRIVKCTVGCVQCPHLNGMETSRANASRATTERGPGTTTVRDPTQCHRTAADRRVGRNWSRRLPD